MTTAEVIVLADECDTARRYKVPCWNKRRAPGTSGPVVTVRPLRIEQAKSSEKKKENLIQSAKVWVTAAAQ